MESHVFASCAPLKSGFRVRYRRQHEPGRKRRRARRGVLGVLFADRINPPLYRRQSLTGCLCRLLQSVENTRRFPALMRLGPQRMCVRKCLTGNSEDVSTDVTKLGLSVLIVFNCFYFYSDQIVLKICLFFFFFNTRLEPLM